MSILFASEEGWVVSHPEYINQMYKNVLNDDSLSPLMFNKTLFEINSQYLRLNQLPQSQAAEGVQVQSKCRKRKRTKCLPEQDSTEMNHIKVSFEKLVGLAKEAGLFSYHVQPDNNKAARMISLKFYTDTFNDERENFYGCNDTDAAIVSQMCGKKYVFPKRCKFYSYDVEDIPRKLECNNQYDFILMDPPWWNKSIRSKKTNYAEASYKMMYNKDLVKIPISKLLSERGIVAIWCTNAPHHLNSIFKELFPAWGLTYRAKWYWIKVTQAGDTICNFSTVNGKQPYELIILGSVLKDNKIEIPDGKLLVSTPSAVHSHKPPLIELVKEYLPKEPNCLEIFARYLLAGWTSWGLEVLKFQHLWLYSLTGEETESIERLPSTDTLLSVS